LDTFNHTGESRYLGKNDNNWIPIYIGMGWGKRVGRLSWLKKKFKRHIITSFFIYPLYFLVVVLTGFKHIKQMLYFFMKN
jgi:hypothetical protein